MEDYNWNDNFQRIIVLKKIILSYLEQYMMYHIEQELNSYEGLKKLIEQQNLRCLFKVLSKGLLLNIEQFIKSRTWMNEENPNSIKNITITSINVIPEDPEKQSHIDSEQDVYGSKQGSSDSLNVFETIIIPERGSELGEDDETKQNEEMIHLKKNDIDITNGSIEYMSGLIVGKLSFVSLALTSINKILEKTKTPAPSGTT